MLQNLALPKRTHKKRSSTRRIALLLFFSHLLILLFLILFSFGLGLVPAFLTTLLSLGISLFIIYRLLLLEKALTRIANGQFIHKDLLQKQWPLTPLFTAIETIMTNMGQQGKMAQQNVAYRDHLLQQVSKTAAQEERNRLARDLHDSIKQQIFSIVVSAAAVKARWEQRTTTTLKIVDDIEQTALEAQVEMQALLQQLRPVALENVGLIESLKMQCQALGYRTGAHIETDLAELPPEDLLPLGTQETIFRIVQEGFANIARHARASRVWLNLHWQDNTLLVEIGDNGQGFDPALLNERPGKDGGMGLCNVRERITALGGTLTIWSRLNEGTRLHLSIPLAQSSRQLQAQAQERLDREVTTTLRLTSRSFHVGTSITQIGATLLFLYLPFYTPRLPFLSLAPLACAILAALAWLWAQQYRLQINFDLGPDHAHSLRLRAHSQGLLAGILTLVLLYPFAFPSLVQALTDPSIIPYYLLPVSLSWLLLLAVSGNIIFLFFRSWRTMNKYYAQLSTKEQIGIIRRLVRESVVDWVAWLSVLAGFTFYLHAVWRIVQTNPAYIYWLMSCISVPAVCILCIWLIMNSTKSLHLLAWRRTWSKPDDKGATVKA